MSDVAVIGGGIIGLTSALFLAREGLSVAVYDRGDLGREASWAGAGILPPGNPDRAATPGDKLRGIGSQRFPEFSAELRHLTGIENGYRRCGGIEFLTAEDADVPDAWAAEGIAGLRGAGPSRVLMFGKRYLVPRGDGLTLVGSTEEPEAGFEKRTTPEGIGGLCGFARRVVPALANAALETSWAGLRPGSPD